MTSEQLLALTLVILSQDHIRHDGGYKEEGNDSDSWQHHVTAPPHDQSVSAKNTQWLP
jgi:hypothetical protein